MKKIDWHVPMTRKDYVVLCVASLVISYMAYAIMMAICYWDKITTWTDNTIRKIKSKLHL